MKAHRNGPLSIIEAIDFILSQLTRANKAELIHDGSLPYRLFDWNQTAARYTKKYAVFLKSGPRDLVPKITITLTFDRRTATGNLSTSPHDLTELRNRLSDFDSLCHNLSATVNGNQKPINGKEVQPCPNTRRQPAAASDPGRRPATSTMRPHPGAAK